MHLPIACIALYEIYNFAIGGDRQTLRSCRAPGPRPAPALNTLSVWVPRLILRKW
jgi:hypothetical protein